LVTGRTFIANPVVEKLLFNFSIGDPSVSIDLLVKSLLALGAKKKNIAKAIA
jgi:hypothetical protein